MTTESTTAPTEQTVEALEAVLKRRMSVTQAVGEGVRLAGRSAITGLVGTLAFAVLGGLVGYDVLQWVVRAQSFELATTQLYAQIFGAGAAFTTLYAILQFTKRDTASRASWWPSLLALPLVLVAGGFAAMGGPQAQQVPLAAPLAAMGWSLAWQSIVGAALAIVWLRPAHDARHDRPTSIGALWDEVRTRTLEVSAPHGASVHAITVGFQILLPGVFYSLQLAFVDMIAVLDPTKPALRRAGQLSTGMRGRLFRLFLLFWAITFVAFCVVVLPVEGVRDFDGAQQELFGLLIDPTGQTRLGFVLAEVVYGLVGWVRTLAVYAMYAEREEQVKAKAALKKLRTMDAA